MNLNNFKATTWHHITPGADPTELVEYIVSTIVNGESKVIKIEEFFGGWTVRLNLDDESANLPRGLSRANLNAYLAEFDFPSLKQIERIAR